MPLISTENLAAIRKGIKRALPEYTLSITRNHHSTVDVHIMSGPIPVVKNVNVYWYKDNLKDRPDAVKVIETIIAEIFRVEKPRTLVEDGDYGNVPTFYYDVSFGKWDKPYVCTDPDAETRLEIRREFDQIKARKEREVMADQVCGNNFRHLYSVV